MGNVLKSTSRMEAPSQFVSERLVLDKAIFARRPDCLLVQPHSIKVAAFEAGDLGRHQSVLVAESRWIVFRPLAQLFLVRRQKGAPPTLLFSSSLLVKHRHRQRAVVKVVEQLDVGRCGPKQRLSLAGW